MSTSERGRISLAHNSSRHFKNQVLVGQTPMSFEVGKVAKQAAGSVWVRWGDTVVLVTVCASNAPKEGADFFPLTCEYITKTYAAGRIPGGFLKRESRPSDDAILNARIIDRSIRPLFPEGYSNEVQVIATVLSHDGIHDADVMALSGASMALSVSNIPFGLQSGPIAGVRLGKVDGKLVVNPSLQDLEKSSLDMIVTVSKDAIVMVEGGANEIPEEELIEALYFAHEEGQKVIEAILEAQSQFGSEKKPFASKELPKEYMEVVSAFALENGLLEALSIKEKQDRYARLDQVASHTVEAAKARLGEGCDEKLVKACFSSIKKYQLREQVLNTQTRIDGRAYDAIRPICSEAGVLPRAHGSALFTRGETQAIVSATLGTREDEQRIDSLSGESSRRFMLHYNFPPFSVGEVKQLRGTSRREIGHGALAERALLAVLPKEEQFPYTLRVVSEITESNGSSSMASVCGGTLALWDAGVNLIAPVAGIAMGLIKEADRVAVLSDILGDEDHLGDMDFKVCGTEKGVTAIQMDIKIDGLSRAIMKKALEQARLGRLHILAEMKKAIEGPRDAVSDFAPKIVMIRINPDKIRDVIGSGGRTIRDIVAKTGAKIDINDDGAVQISGISSEAVAKAKQIVEDITREAQVNMTYKGIVKRVVDFGAFVEIFHGTEGLVHVSELADGRVQQVSDVLREGDEVVVAVLSIDREGKIRLSRKRAMGKQAGEKIV